MDALVQLPDGGWTYVLSVVVVSLQVSVTAVGLSTLFSLPVALLIGFTDFPGKGIVTAIINTGMGFPSVVVGLVVLMVLSNSGPLGDLRLAFTPEAMIASQFVLATPVITSISLSAVEGVDQSVRDAAYAMGGTGVDVGLVVIKEARYGIVTAVLAGFGRAISEVGSILIVGGNIVFSDGQSYTRTLTTAITVEARQGRYEVGLALGAVLLVLVLGVNALGSWIRRRGRGAAGGATAGAGGVRQ
ncbi:molybdenum ABC transporter permease [Halobacteriales archaeon QS_5_70_17]|jgi:tungstate transport system permease protein|nr:MAG: molybdenum ABC transporter permease [Halobacteriales archaeon QS_5_70_17]